MPDGFDPHKELARIYTLRDVMQSMRARLPVYEQVIDDCLSDPDPKVRLAAVQIGMDRGFGKARQHVVVSEIGSNEAKRVVILPDNGRDRNRIGAVIDAKLE